jgi:hypothetical protein
MTAPVMRGTVAHYMKIEQGSDEWLAARCGLLTASVTKHLLTGKFAIASNDKERMLLWELLAQRITGRVDDNFQSWDMIRGHEEEVRARDLYAATYAEVQQCGFITNDEWGFTLGFSPDGLLKGKGFLECKSRKAKLQIKHIVERASQDMIDDDHMVQIQTGLLVSKREWADVISFSNGMPMSTVRVEPIDAIQDAILAAAEAFEKRLADARKIYDDALLSDARLLPTEYIEREIPGDDEIDAPEGDE